MDGRDYKDVCVFYLFVQEECASVVVLLHELVLALGGFVGDLLRVVFQLLPALVLCHVPQPIDVLHLFFSSLSLLPVSFHPLQFSKLPCLVFSLLVFVVSVDSVQTC